MPYTRVSRNLLPFCLFATGVAFCGCGGSYQSNQLNLTPTITTISPSSAVAAGSAFTLTVSGTNFLAASMVNFGGTARATTFVSATQLTASIPANAITTVGAVSVTVTNPAPGGGTSNAATFTVTTSDPTITMITPSTGLAGGAPFVLTVSGVNFASGSVVNFGGTALASATYSSPTVLYATVPAAAIATAGTVPVSVTNPAPGGRTSNTVNFTVTSGPYPTPAINALNPSGAVAGGATFTLSVYGSNFVAGSKVRWNGTDRPTTVLTNTAANAQIPASDIAATGTASITVFSPAPGGGTSNSLTFTIAAAGVYPKSVAVDPSGKYAYVANSGSNNVSTYAINADGTLTRKATIAAGANPYSVAVDPSGKFAYVANNLSNNVSMYTINADGTLASNGTIAAGMAPSSVTVHPSGKFAYVANAGDFSNVRGDVSMYTINTSTGTLTSIGSPIAADFGAVSVAVDQSGKFAYVANTGDFDFFAGSVSMYTINSTTGALTANGAVAAQGGTLGPISVAIDPSGKFVYVANDEGFTPAVSMYSIDTTTGKLTSIGTISAGGFVLSVIVHPSGKFVYATSESYPFITGNVAMFRLDTSTGALTSIGTVPEERIPLSIAIDPAGNFAYVTNYDSHSISMYSINTTTGALTLVGRIGT